MPDSEAELRTCLDLFAGLGGFSAAFEDADGWDVVTVDIAERFDPDIRADVLDLRPADLPEADVVLCSPPCGEFSPAQNLNGPHEPDPEAVAMVYHAIGLIRALDPDYWLVENPRGRLRSYLGHPTGSVTYCQYGRDTQKPTDLWGEHPDGLTYRSCPRNAECHVSTRAGTNEMPNDPAEKARVPYDLSKAILDAVEGVGQQTTLNGVSA